MKNAPGHHTGLDIQNLYIEQDGCCHYCGKAFVDRAYHVDHMTPLSRGGTNWPSNLALACPACNLSKHDMTDQEFLDYRLNRSRMASALGQFLEDNEELMARLAD